ncbi:hypothetical protein PLICBS_002726 [Purpureocillium lilacinum]|nr:hypothetical protein PLICBS_002726 [Purpureocillium lilacinum]
MADRSNANRIMNLSGQEKERLWEEKTERLREEERRKAEEEKRQRAEQERQWQLAEQKRLKEDREAEAPIAGPSRDSPLDIRT